uniref:Uncharacterized protein n=1 Tax=Caenorhabditis japonica TaxID=281687 RepID=A0A8R1EB33_CAEJA
MPPKGAAQESRRLPQHDPKSANRSVVFFFLASFQPDHVSTNTAYYEEESWRDKPGNPAADIPTDRHFVTPTSPQHTPIMRV